MWVIFLSSEPVCRMLLVAKFSRKSINLALQSQRVVLGGVVVTGEGDMCLCNVLQSDDVNSSCNQVAVACENMFFVSILWYHLLNAIGLFLKSMKLLWK